MPIPSIVAAVSALCLAQPGGGDVVNDDPKAESRFLGEVRQLTFAEDWAKAGESYFSPDGKWVVFQAVPQAEEGEEPGSHYGMYVASYQEGQLGHAALMSEAGSANTCGWFHPEMEYRLIFGSTIAAPKEENQPGYQRGSGRYRWAFPSEMNVVAIDLASVSTTATGYDESGQQSASRTGPYLAPDVRTNPSYRHGPAYEILFEREGYTAECSYSPDARHILYAQVDEAKSNEIGRPDADIWVFDTETEEHTILVEAEGYDGGPFFSPDGKWICYRSDRKGDNLLQLFVSELAYDEKGQITGISREIQLTNNRHVNWAPFWHPSGEFLVYASSEVSHGNYEVFALPFDANEPEKTQEPVRITYASGFDGLPVFSADGEWMMWTAQRGEDRSPDGKASSQLWIAKWKGLEGAE
ncbi:MAG: TolB family protein [Phycisphaerales bacterium JB058]